MYIHTFGAIFGVMCSWAYANPKEKQQKFNGSSYHSNLFGLIGTIFLWMYWPSFNGALQVGNGKSRAAINTLLGMITSVFGAMMTSMACHKGKMNAEQVLNATLAGGVAMGASADMLVNPFICLIIGFCCGVISCLGYQIFPNLVYKYLRLHDTCGVIYLHLIPGILGGLISGLVAGVTDEKHYGADLNSIFIKRGGPGMTRGHSMQGGIQIATLFTSLAIGALAGAITGLILRIPGIWGAPKVYYHDKAFFDFHGGDHDADIGDIDQESIDEPPNDEKHDKKTKKTKGQEIDKSQNATQFAMTTDQNLKRGYNQEEERDEDRQIPSV